MKVNVTFKEIIMYTFALIALNQINDIYKVDGVLAAVLYFLTIFAFLGIAVIVVDLLFYYLGKLLTKARGE